MTDFTFAPDGSCFTTGEKGRVAWVSTTDDRRPVTGEARTLAEIDRG